MTRVEKSNPGHSIFQRLLIHAKTRGENFNLMLFRYSAERLLYRLSISSHADRFVLKGASLFLVWKGQNFRVTKDVDLLGFGPADADHITTIFKDLCRVVPVENDGIQFIPETIRSVPIRDDQLYDGIRVTFVGLLHKARIPLQFDIGFGDVVTPGPEWVEFPTLLDGQAPRLLAYPRYTTVAEKLEALVHLGIANSRMKDFYDLWLLGRIFGFKGPTLCKAIRNTFGRRSTPLPAGLPLAFSEEFRKDTKKQIQWRAFVKKSKPESVSENFDAIINEVAGFLLPVIEAVRVNEHIKGFWQPGGPWIDKSKR